MTYLILKLTTTFNHTLAKYLLLSLKAMNLCTLLIGRGESDTNYTFNSNIN